MGLLIGDHITPAVGNIAKWDGTKWVLVPDITAHTALTNKEVSGVIDHAPESVRDGHLYDWEAWRRLLDVRPDQALKILKQTWTAPGGMGGAEDIIFDGTFIYLAGSDLTNAKVWQINPTTMATVATWTGDGGAGEGMASCLAFDGTYIYAGVKGFAGPPPAQRVMKIDPSDMTTVDFYVMAADEDTPSALIYDGTYIYCALEIGGPAIVLQINPSDMTRNNRWEGAGLDDAHCLAFDGIYIYVGLYMIPGEVHKLDPATMTSVAHWTGGVDENWPTDLVFDGTYIYASLYRTPGEIKQINPTTMATVATWTGAGGENRPQELTFDGTYLYAILQLDPIEIVKIDIPTMVTISKWTGAAGEAPVASLGFDGTFLHVGLQLMPAKIIRKLMRDLDETGV